jgi:hypothetical protein
VPFLHAGEEILRSKSLDRNSYNSGDWFNKLDWTYQSNNWGVGLPPAGDNQSNWDLMRPRLADPNLKPATGDILSAFAHARELYRIRESSPLFRLQTEADVMARLQFHNVGPDQIPGLIVMSLSDKVAGLPDLDPAHEQIVVLFNATDEVQSFTLGELRALGFRLHPVQTSSADGVVRQANFDPRTATFTVPARTTAVFVQGDKTLLTIRKDAQPDSRTNFRFEGTLGNFRLDDPGFDDGDPFGAVRTFEVLAGNYVIQEKVPNQWYLTSLACDVAGRSATSQAEARVTVSIFPGDHVTCTFVNSAGITLLSRVYDDKNGDGDWKHEKGLKDWKVTVYTAAGVKVAEADTNGNGKANFWYLAPGSYKICAATKAGWTNTEPGVLDAGLGNQPCYAAAVPPGQMAEYYFGFTNNRGQGGGQGHKGVGAAAVSVIPNPYLLDGDDAAYDAATPFVDLDVELPFAVRSMFLPAIGR